MYIHYVENKMLFLVAIDTYLLTFLVNYVINKFWHNRVFEEVKDNRGGGGEGGVIG